LQSKSILGLFGIIMFVAGATLGSYLTSNDEVTPEPLNTAAIEQEVLNAFEQLISASKNLDTQAYFQLFDGQHFVGLGGNGSNWQSLEELRAIVESGFQAIERIDSLEFDRVKVSVIDEQTVLLINEYDQALTLKNGASIHAAGGGVQVWSKRKGEWKLISVSDSAKPSAN
jgi:hypothetical protein